MVETASLIGNSLHSNQVHGVNRGHHWGGDKDTGRPIDPENRASEGFKATLGQAVRDGQASETKGGTKGQGASMPPIMRWAHQLETAGDPDEAKGMIQGPHELQAVADKLGMSLGQLSSALRSGKTLADLAGDESVSIQELSDAAAVAAKARLDKALKAGRIDQAAADSILADVQEGRWIEQLLGAYERQA